MNAKTNRFMAKESYYFTHDYNAREDQKIKKMIFEMGMEGYGIYWSLIEILYQNDGEFEYNPKLLSFDLRINYKKIQKVVENFELFDKNSEKFWSNSVKNRLNFRKNRQEVYRENANLRWNQTKPDAIASELHNEKNAIASELQCKSDALKEKKRKEKKSIYNDDDKGAPREPLTSENSNPDDLNKFTEDAIRIYYNRAITQADILFHQELIKNGYTIEEIKESTMKAFEQLGGKIKHSYVRAILSNQRQGIKKDEQSYIRNTKTNSFTDRLNYKPNPAEYEQRLKEIEALGFEPE